MPSPFPGMDPYLEKRSLWAGVHNRLIYNIADILMPLLAPKYVATIDDRLQLASDSARHFVPDVALVEKQIREPAAAYQTERDVLVADEPMIATAFSDERRVRYVEIVEVSSGDVVTVIELLSPANKEGKGREKYLNKQDAVWDSSANFVEIDLLSYGQNTVLAREISAITPKEWRYIVSTSRAAVRKQSQIEYYAFTLQDRLPRCKIPLRDPDPDVVLDLPTAFTQSYDSGRYDLLVDYGKLPEDGVLDEGEQGWVKGMVSAETDYSPEISGRQIALSSEGE